MTSGTISGQPTGDPPSLGKVRELEKLIDSQMQNETRQHMLRSATRWHELGERNNKYFYRVIKGTSVSTDYTIFEVLFYW